MSLAAPWFLLALLIIPAGIALQRAAARRRRRFAVRFPATGTVAAVLASTPAWRKKVPPVLLTLAVAALAVALARPQRSVAVPVERASIMLVTDVSRSMQAEDVEPSRLAAAQQAGLNFLSEAPPSLRVGHLSYSTAVNAVQRPTTEREAVRSGIEELIADGATATGDGLAGAMAALGRDPDATSVAKARALPPAAIILLSDGKTTEGRDPVDVARAARRLGVPIFTVALGTPDGVLSDPYGNEQPVPPDPDTLRQIASLSGGEFQEVSDRGKLNDIYERLGRKLGTRTEQREVTSGFAGIAFLLLTAALFFTVRWRGRV